MNKIVKYKFKSTSLVFYHNKNVDTSIAILSSHLNLMNIEILLVKIHGRSTEGRKKVLPNLSILNEQHKSDNEKVEVIKKKIFREIEMLFYGFKAVRKRVN